MKRCSRGVNRYGEDFEQKAMAVQVFATPVLSFDSELTLHTETTMARLDRKVHSVLHKTNEMEKPSVAPAPPEPSCEVLGNQNSEKSSAGREYLRELVVYLIRQKMTKEENEDEAKGPVSAMLKHMGALGWTLNEQLVITRRHGTMMHLTKERISLFDHWLREDLRRMIWTKEPRNEEQEGPTRHSRESVLTIRQQNR